MIKEVFGVILAGGTGQRMGNSEKPKQFMEIGGKPILIHTIEKFLLHEEFEKIIVLTPASWIKTTEDLIKRYFQINERLIVIEGGATRNETVMNSIRYIEENYALTDNTIIVTHDAVRPFVTYRIIDENIKQTEKYGACDTVIPASDTIVCSKDGDDITEIPNRTWMYQGQTPQSFKAKKLKEHYSSLSREEKEILTDAAKIMVLKGEKVHLIQGEVYNIKITYPYDMRVAQSFLEEEK